MIEGAILGRPVLSLLTPEFAGTQEGTLHFHYLLPENGGFLRVAHSLDEHETQLAEVLRHPELVREQTERFVGAFLRPHGLDVACTPILAGALERAARETNTTPARESIATRALRGLAIPVALFVKLFGKHSPLRAKRGGIKKAYPKTKRAARETAKDIARSQAVIASRADKLAKTVVKRTSKSAAKARKTAGAALRWPYARAMRLLRQARYGVATRILGRR
jgi:hypothetical protein